MYFTLATAVEIVQDFFMPTIFTLSFDILDLTEKCGTRISVLMVPFLLNLRDPPLQAPAFSVPAPLALAVPTSSTPELNGSPFFSEQDHRLQQDCRLSPVLSG